MCQVCYEALCPLAVLMGLGVLLRLWGQEKQRPPGMSGKEEREDMLFVSLPLVVCGYLFRNYPASFSLSPRKGLACNIKPFGDPSVHSGSMISVDFIPKALDLFGSRCVRRRPSFRRRPPRGMTW